MADLIPWEALDEILEFFQVLEKVFEEEFAGPELRLDNTSLQKSEIREDNQKLSVKLIIPDEFKDKLNVKVDGTKIEIFGRVENNDAWKSVYHCFSLPKGSAGEKATVNMDGNCLLIEVPKA